MTMPMTGVKMAAIQMVSAPELAPNLEAAARLISEAVDAGARLVALPENFYIIGRNEGDKVALRERDGAGPIQDFLSSTARKLKVWIVGGTAPISIADPQRIRSACLVYDDTGRRVARYDKMHLFHFDGGAGERYAETRTVEPGEQPLACESPFGRLAISVCYDIRFPELYRGLGAFDVMFAPSAFTVPTGAAHWETLLKARAIENQAYVVAPAQGGVHASGRRTYGHSMVIDPWGEVLAVRPEGEGTVVAEIDPKRIAEVRASLPALSNRRIRSHGDSIDS
jgi:nitrilase